MTRRYRMVIFDWDGTLMDSLANIVSSMQQAALAVELAPRSEPEIHEIIGLGLPEAIRVLYPELSLQQADSMREHYATSYLGNLASESGLYSGIRPLLDELHRGEVPLSIATGKSRRGLDRVLASQQVAHLFRSSRCADESRSKPHPQMLLDLLDLHCLSPDQVVMVGDTEHDLRMAHAAGVDAVGVSWGAHAKPRLLACQPVYCANSVTELHDWLRDAALGL